MFFFYENIDVKFYFRKSSFLDPPSQLKFKSNNLIEDKENQLESTMTELASVIW